jgi:hypothetical protein
MNVLLMLMSHDFLSQYRQGLWNFRLSGEGDEGIASSLAGKVNPERQCGKVGISSERITGAAAPLSQRVHLSEQRRFSGTKQLNWREERASVALAFSPADLLSFSEIS